MSALALRAISGATQTAIAAALGVSEATLSRLKSDHLEIVMRVLAHAGLKVVPAHYKCYDPRQLDALFVLAQGQFGRAKTIDDVLYWDEDEE